MSFLYNTFTIWYREMMRYRRNVRYLIAQLVFPLLFIIAIGFGFNNIITLPGKTINYVDFLSSGVLVFFIASGALGGGFNLIEERQTGFLKVVIIAPLSRSSIILGKIFGRITFSTVQVLVFTSILLTFAHITLSMLWLTILALMMMAAIFVCIGIILASFLRDADGFRLISGFIMMPIYFISGIFFPVTTLPTWLQVIAKANPLTYAVDLFRYSLTGTHEFSLAGDVTLLAVLSVVVYIAAVVLFDKKFRD